MAFGEKCSSKYCHVWDWDIVTLSTSDFSAAYAPKAAFDKYEINLCGRAAAMPG